MEWELYQVFDRFSALTGEADADVKVEVRSGTQMFVIESIKLDDDTGTVVIDIA